MTGEMRHPETGEWHEFKYEKYREWLEDYESGVRTRRVYGDKEEKE